jgi:hypothetical protein
MELGSLFDFLTLRLPKFLLVTPHYGPDFKTKSMHFGEQNEQKLTKNGDKM